MKETLSWMKLNSLGGILVCLSEHHKIHLRDLHVRKQFTVNPLSGHWLFLPPLALPYGCD